MKRPLVGAAVGSVLGLAFTAWSLRGAAAGGTGDCRVLGFGRGVANSVAVLSSERPSRWSCVGFLAEEPLIVAWVAAFVVLCAVVGAAVGRLYPP